MKYKELTPEEALDMLASTKKPIEVEVKTDIRGWVNAKLTAVDLYRDKDELEFFCRVKTSTGTESCLWYSKVRIKVESKIRPMNKFEMAKKIDCLRYDNATSEGYVWRVGFQHDYKTIGYWNTEGEECMTYAKFDLQGNKISEDFKFEVEE